MSKTTQQTKAEQLATSLGYALDATDLDSLDATMAQASEREASIVGTPAYRTTGKTLRALCVAIGKVRAWMAADEASRLR